MKLGRIRNQAGRNEDRAERRVGVETFGETPLRDTASKGRVSLPFSRRYVISCGVCSDVFECIGLSYVLCIFTYDDDLEKLKNV